MLIVGDYNNEYGQDLKSRYENEAIRFLGKKQDVRPYINSADLFVISTKEIGEGLPVAPLEAMAMGKIVIGSDVPGIRDILSDFSEQLFKAGNIRTP